MGVQTETCPWCGHQISRERFLEIQKQIREEEKARAAAAEATLRKQLQLQHQNELAKARQADQLTIAQTAGRLKTLQQQLEQQRVRDLAVQRASLERDRDSLLLKKDAEFNREREKFQKKILELDRQVKAKSAQQLGDGAEIDLFEVLKEAFPNDHITRIEKGEPGGDILHEIKHRGEPCGRILIDAKNRQSWQNAFITKLRADQVDAKAEHAILASTVFPAGKKELFVDSGVIVVNPARAVHVVEMLRTATIALHVKNLSLKDRAGKMQRLYKLITSEGYGTRFREAGQLADDILDLDVDEKKTHDNVWKRRGALTRRMQTLLRELDTDVAAIIEADQPSAASVA